MSEAAHGWSGGWKADNELAEDVDDTVCGVAEPGLKHPALEAKGLAQPGGAFSAFTSGPVEIHRGLEAPIDWKTVSRVYLRALVRWGGNHPTGASRVRLSLDGKNYSFIGLQGDNENRNMMRLVVRNRGEDAWGEELCPAGPVYLLVAKIETSPAGEDVISASIFDENRPLPDTEPQDWDVSAAKARSDESSTLGINTQLYVDQSVAVDEVVMADSYESLFGE